MRMKASILLVEDNETIRRGLSFSLKKENFKVNSFSNAEEALLSLENNTYDLIVLDLMLPFMNGEQFLDKMVASCLIPVIVISAVSDEFTQINLYNKKIEDYVVKPFSTNILLLKIEAILRRTNVSAQQVTVNYGSVTLEVDNYTLYDAGKQIELTSREFDLLQSMLLNQGKVFTREELITVHWGYNEFIDPRTIDAHIKNLRRKLSTDIIQTVKGVGYRIERKQ
ncbi:response regulator transcription factor [Enterococcus faecalis]|nr:response regulator transcription factor [Enterococcus faecalis]